MSTISTKECEEYSSSNGLIWIGTEDNTKWPRGCYHVKDATGTYTAVWFNTNVHTIAACDTTRVIKCICKGK